MALTPNNMPAPLVFENVTKQQFENELQAMSKPFVMKDFASNWDIVKRAKRSNADMIGYLRDASANQQLPISTTRIPASEKSRMFYDPHMKAMNFGVAELSLSACLNRMLDTYRAGCDKKEADYAAQCVSLKKFFPSVDTDITNPLVEKGVVPFIWFGNQVVVAPHFDESDNIAVVASGKRRFTVFPPSQTKNLYIGPLDFTPAGQAISLVNILNPDLREHPKYEQAYQHGMSIELAPGDAIYIPTPWWHHVQSLSDFNILINYWWNQNAYGTSKPLGALLHAMQAFKTLPPSQQNDFKALLDYYVFGDATQTNAHIPKHAHGWLGDLTDEKRKELDHWIKAFSQ